MPRVLSNAGKGERHHERGVHGRAGQPRGEREASHCSSPIDLLPNSLADETEPAERAEGVRAGQRSAERAEV